MGTITVVLTETFGGNPVIDTGRVNEHNHPIFEVSRRNLDLKRLHEDIRTKAKGKFFTVHFIKREDGSPRTMNALIGVYKHTKGGELAYDPKSKDLLNVWDAQIPNRSEAYRMINLRGIRWIRVGGREYQFV